MVEFRCTLVTVSRANSSNKLFAQRLAVLNRAPLWTKQLSYWCHGCNRILLPLERPFPEDFGKHHTTAWRISLKIYSVIWKISCWSLSNLILNHLNDVCREGVYPGSQGRSCLSAILNHWRKFVLWVVRRSLQYWVKVLWSSHYSFICHTRWKHVKLVCQSLPSYPVSKEALKNVSSHNTCYLRTQSVGSAVIMGFLARCYTKENKMSGIYPTLMTRMTNKAYDSSAAVSRVRDTQKVGTSKGIKTIDT